MSAALRFALSSLLALLLSVAWAGEASAQSKGVLTRGKVIDGDTLPCVRLAEVLVFAPLKFKSERKRRQYTRFVYNVKKALPYARLLTQELKIINDSLAVLPDEASRNAFLARKEKELFAKYEDRLKKLTIKQGRILIKLIDRETGSTSYDVIRMLKGGFKAFWWQGLARMFGSNLKSEYDPDGMDKNIENVVLLIDKGVY